MLREVGIAAILVESVSRLFLRNSIARAIPIFMAPGISGIVDDGETLEVDYPAGVVRNRAHRRSVTCASSRRSSSRFSPPAACRNPPTHAICVKPADQRLTNYRMSTADNQIAPNGSRNTRPTLACDTLPAALVNMLKQCVLDTLGVTIGASGLAPEAKILAD